MGPHPVPASDTFDVTVGRLWRETLGASASPDVGFIDNGGDSLVAVLLANEIFAATGREVSYLDILLAAGVADLCGRLASAGPAGPA